MGVSGLVPYVDIVIDPALRATLRNLKRRFSDASDVDPSPKKKRLRSGYDSSNEVSIRSPLPTTLNSDRSCIQSSQGDLDQPLSPTVSDYEFEVPDCYYCSAVPLKADNRLNNNCCQTKGHMIPTICRRLCPFSTADTAKNVNVRFKLFLQFVSCPFYEKADYYTPGDEVAEDAQLRISGETAPVEEDSDCTIPIRLLSDYAIYNLETRQLVAVDELLQLDYCKEQYAASGLVRPWFGDGDSLDDGQSDDDDRRSSASVSEDDRITLTRLLEFSIHSSSEEDLLDS